MGQEEKEEDDDTFTVRKSRTFVASGSRRAGTMGSGEKAAMVPTVAVCRVRAESMKHTPTFGVVAADVELE